MKPITVKIIAGFLLLFACYHAAEYSILSHNSSVGFLLFSVLFFLLAFFVARWQGDKNLNGWGLPLKKTFPSFFLTGLLMGFLLNALMFLTCLILDIEIIRFIPSLKSFLIQGSLLVFGSALSSLTEDVLTRCYVYRRLKNRVGSPVVVLLSALVFALNHIYRLNQPVYFLFAFVLGVQLAIPLLLTKNIWYSFGVHWAGNIVYHLTNNVAHSSSGSNAFPSIVVALIFAFLSIPIHAILCAQLVSDKSNATRFLFRRHSSHRIRHSSSLV